jgi:hypothetical protein
VVVSLAELVSDSVVGSGPVACWVGEDIAVRSTEVVVTAVLDLSSPLLALLVGSAAVVDV